MKFHTNFSQKSAQIWENLIWNRSVMCLISQENLFLMKFHTNFSQKMHKIGEIWFGRDVLCDISLKEVFSDWNLILISAKNKRKIEKFWFGIKA